MKRKVIDELIKWKNLGSKKPILLTGVKGVGKTYLAYDFAKAFFEDILYYNLERDPGNCELLQSLTTADSQAIKLSFPGLLDIPSENRLLILDEIKYCEAAVKLVSNPAFRKHFPHMIAISSSPLPEADLNNFVKLPIYPMEFDEFLRATGNDWYIEAIVTHFQTDKKIPDIVHKELLVLHELYLKIGGMPSLINEYLNLSSLVNIPELHGFITSSYRDSIQQEYANSDSLKMIQVFDSIPQQLLKENRKFQYKLIRKGTTHSMYKDAISQLTDIGYVIRCNRISSEQLVQESSRLSEAFISNESSNENSNNFKLYLMDTGILNSKFAEINPGKERTYCQKALLENFVAQSLQAKHYSFGFWESDSMAKVDFLIQKEGELLPIEVYEGVNTRSKSISILKQKCSFPYAIKISQKNFEFSNQIKYVPYYAMFCI